MRNSFEVKLKKVENNGETIEKLLDTFCRWIIRSARYFCHRNAQTLRSMGSL